MKTSVAMCTYNGAKYIEEQLRSILNQTMPVDEIVISDDGSTDQTVALINAIAATTTIPIRLQVNTVNKGFKQNFIDTILMCEGDIVFLSDQDDRWKPEKVEKIVSWFNNHPTMQVVFTNGNLIDGEGKPLGETMFHRIGFDKKKQQYFLHGFAEDILAWGNRATGATMAIKNEFTRCVDYERFDVMWFHDHLYAIAAQEQNALGFITETLIDYRLHENNNTGMNTSKYPEVFYSAKVPLPWKAEWEHVVSQDLKKRSDFRIKRALFRHTWFGVKVCIYIYKYIEVYGAWWYKAFLYDWRQSISHSFYRIVNKINRILDNQNII